MSDHFDLGSQPQQGDLDEDKMRLDYATELAAYLIKHPSRVGSVRYRVWNLSRVSEPELNKLAELVEHLIDLDAYQKRSKGIMVKTYDSKSYELAEHFMQDDESPADSEERKRLTHELALAIQAAVEDFLFEERGQL